MKNIIRLIVGLVTVVSATWVPMPQGAAAQEISEDVYQQIEDAATRPSDLPAEYTRTRGGWVATEGGGVADRYNVSFMLPGSARELGPSSVHNVLYVTSNSSVAQSLLSSIAFDGFLEEGLPRFATGKVRAFSRLTTLTDGRTLFREIIAAFYVDNVWGLVMISGVAHVTTVDIAFSLAALAYGRLNGANTDLRGPAFNLAR